MQSANPLSASLEWICGRPHAVPIQRQLLHWLLFFSGVIALLVSFLFLVLGLPLFTALLGSIICFGGYALLRLRQVAPLFIKLMPFAIYFLTSTYSWFQGGGIHGSLPFYVLLPFLAALTALEGWTRKIMIALIVAQIVGLTYLQSLYPTWVVAHPSLQIQQSDLFFSICLIVIFCIGYTGVLIHNLEEHNRQIDTMLYNILPVSVAKTLQQHPDRNIAHYFENVSILFADIVDFTPLSAGLTPVALVSLLNELFSDFDALVIKHGVEKIKTIGDCYMIAAGAPTTCPHHAHVLARLALEMQQLVNNKRYQGHRLAVRIGINSGSVVAGVIGTNKFAYDLWGDTVNTASRMESQSSAGVIQITRATYELIRHDFICQAQGQIPIKGKGVVAVWRLLDEYPAHVSYPVSASTNSETVVSETVVGEEVRQ